MSPLRRIEDVAYGDLNPTVVYIYIFIQHHNDTTSKTDAMNKRRMIKTQEGLLLEKYSPLTLLQGVRKVSM